MRAKWTFYIFVILFVATGCQEGNNDASKGDSESDSDSVRDSTSASDTDSDSVGESDVDTVTNSDSDYVGPPDYEGIAPFGVFFDLSSYSPEYLGMTFAWNFDVDNGDPTGRHEVVSGFVAGHVYEKPGSYKIQVRIFDDGGYRETKSWRVEVGSMSGKEIYVAASGTDTGAGTIDDPIRSVSEAFRIFGKPNTTIFLKRGDTFNVSSIVVEGAGPVIVRDYGDQSASLPVIQSADVDSAHNVMSIRTQGWRFLNLRITTTRPNPDPGTLRYPGGIELTVDATQNVLLGMDFVNLGGTAVSLGGEDNFIVDSNFHDFGGNGFYGSESVNQRNSIIGNRVYATRAVVPEHIVRLHEASRYFIAENNFLATDTKSSVQFREASSMIVLFGNMLDRSSGIGPTNETTDGEMHHIVVDSNVFVGRAEAPPYDNTYPVRRLGLGISAATDVVVRNNVFFNYELGVETTIHPISGPSERIRIHNNTFVCNDIYCGGVRTCGGACSEIEIYNSLQMNLSTDPPAGDRMLEVTSSVWSGISDYNMFSGLGWPSGYEAFRFGNARLTFTDWQSQSGMDLHSIQANADFVSTAFPMAESAVETVDIRALLASGKIFTPIASGPAVGSGWTGAPALDFFGKERGTAPSIGAIEP